MKLVNAITIYTVVAYLGSQSWLLPQNTEPTPKGGVMQHFSH